MLASVTPLVVPDDPTVALGEQRRDTRGGGRAMTAMGSMGSGIEETLSSAPDQFNDGLEVPAGLERRGARPQSAAAGLRPAAPRPGRDDLARRDHRDHPGRDLRPAVRQDHRPRPERPVLHAGREEPRHRPAGRPQRPLLAGQRPGRTGRAGPHRLRRPRLARGRARRHRADDRDRCRHGAARRVLRRDHRHRHRPHHRRVARDPLPALRDRADRGARPRRARAAHHRSSPSSAGRRSPASSAVR